MINKLTLVTIFIILFQANSYSQCCAAGNPSGSDISQEGLGKNFLKVNLLYKYSLSKDYFHLNKKYPLPYIEKSNFNYSNISVAYGLSQKLSINTEIGYFINKSQELKINNENILINSSGIGDISVNARYKLMQKVKPFSQLYISAGTKIPVGAFNEEIDGVTIPISLQPSSGALKFNGGIFYLRKSLDRKLGWYSFAIFEISNTINKGYLTYKYGNYLQYSLAGVYSLSKKLSAIGNIKVEFRDHDKREQNLKVESSGSKVVYFSPQFQYNFKNSWNIVINADIPIYKYVNGYQLTNKFAFSFGIYKTFNLQKSNENSTN